MNLNFDLNIIVLLTIAFLSGLVSWEFYRSSDGRLRVLIIALFITKVWVYGGSAMIMMMGGDIGLVERLVLNIPMFLVMLELWRYIRTHNK